MGKFWVDLRGPRTIARRQEAIARERDALREKANKKAHWNGRDTIPRESVAHTLEEQFASTDGPVRVLLPPREISTRDEHGFAVVVIRQSDWKRASALVFIGEGSSIRVFPPAEWVATSVAATGQIADYDTELSAILALGDDGQPVNQRAGLDDDVLTDPSAEIDRLNDLRDRGLVNDDEYHQKFSDALDRL